MYELISIVVPVYNTGDYLGNCVASIVQQDYPELEAILVDDGSTDGFTPQLCDKLADRYESVRSYHKQNGGSASARNFGISKAKGNYIGFVDSDDVIDAQMYSTLYNQINQNRLKVAICGISTEEKGKATFNDAGLLSGCYNNHDLMHHFLLGHWHSACTSLYEKSLLDGVAFPEGEVNEDYVFNYKIFKTLDKLYFVNKPLYHYLRRDDSNTGAPKTMKFLEWIQHTQAILDDLRDNQSLKLEAEYQYLYSNIILANSVLMTLNRMKSEEAEKLYDIVTSNLYSNRKMLQRNKYLSTRNKWMGRAMAYTPGLYKASVLTVLKTKKVL